MALGDDWIAPHSTAGREMRARRERRARGLFNVSPMTRKIVTFNFLALACFAVGLFWFLPSRSHLTLQHSYSVMVEAERIADVFENEIADRISANFAAGDGIDARAILSALNLRDERQAFLFDVRQNLIGTTPKAENESEMLSDLRAPEDSSTAITGFLHRTWAQIAALFGQAPIEPARDIPLEQMRDILPIALSGETHVQVIQEPQARVWTFAITPVMQSNETVALVALAAPNDRVEAMLQLTRERVLWLFIGALAISFGLSLVLASTIASPLADLADAAELSHIQGKDPTEPPRFRMPDMGARPDEIGQLSEALQGMVTALYDRIEGNEQFAADVVHEIKNPLASLRSAVATLRSVEREDQREKLLEVIEHDVRRIDRLATDISNASRLDAELVKEVGKPFNLIKTISDLTDYFSQEAQQQGVNFIVDLPKASIVVNGLEERLAQVFVNIIANALSFCVTGDTIRVWVRKHESRILVVVDDTGPGIPEEALTKIFDRFYSERPENQFGNNSGLGLAISKQIVEAHEGVIWAENIYPTDGQEAASDPLGARLVVGLPA